jgi:uncharacterized protein
MARLVHFEIPADDMERAKTFYPELFGWKIAPSEVSSEYWMVSTDEGEGAVGGGMMKRRDPAQPVVNYIDVPSVEDGMKKVGELGGSVIVSKMPVPGMGYFAVCKDTENNVFGLWETDPEAAVFRDGAEVFTAILLAVVASDQKYSVDEMRTVWDEAARMEIFRDRDYKDIETRVLSYFEKNASEPTPFSPDQINMILTSAKRLLSPEDREKAFKAAVKVAYSERTLDGYLLMESDDREENVLNLIRKEFEISEQKARAAFEETKKGL